MIFESKVALFILTIVFLQNKHYYAQYYFSDLLFEKKTSNKKNSFMEDFVKL